MGWIEEGVVEEVAAVVAVVVVGLGVEFKEEVVKEGGSKRVVGIGWDDLLFAFHKSLELSSPSFSLSKECPRGGLKTIPPVALFLYVRTRIVDCGNVSGVT